MSDQTSGTRCSLGEGEKGTHLISFFRQCAVWSGKTKHFLIKRFTSFCSFTNSSHFGCLGCCHFSPMDSVTFFTDLSGLFFFFTPCFQWQTKDWSGPDCLKRILQFEMLHSWARDYQNKMGETKHKEENQFSLRNPLIITRVWPAKDYLLLQCFPILIKYMLMLLTSFPLLEHLGFTLKGPETLVQSQSGFTWSSCTWSLSGELSYSLDHVSKPEGRIRPSE